MTTKTNYMIDIDKDFYSLLLKAFILVLVFFTGYMTGAILEHENIAKQSEQYVYEVITENCVNLNKFGGGNIRFITGTEINISEQGWLNDG